MTFTTSITSISFNTINNPTAKPAGYGDYTALTTSVYKGSTYNLTVKANTAGNYTVHTFAWIDWNQDGDFSDTGEAYDLGSAINVTNGITTLSPISILIPSTALTGNTRMRLAAKYSTNPILCETSFDGEVEDYSINVLATITGSKRVNISAGGLSNALTTTEKSTTTNLTITGTLDARDFVTLRDLMPKLAVVDISATSIVSYTGTAGTIGTSSYLYPANEIPKYAFYNYTTGTDNKTLISIVLPNTITSIGDNAFYFCFGLISANIPTSVNAIGSYAFYACWDLTSINIPLSVTTIGNGSLTNIFGPINVDVNNTKYSSQNGILFDKNKTILIQFTTSQSGSYSVPSTVTNIEDESFEYCNNITSIK